MTLAEIVTQVMKDREGSRDSELAERQRIWYREFKRESGGYVCHVDAWNDISPGRPGGYAALSVKDVCATDWEFLREPQA